MKKLLWFVFLFLLIINTFSMSDFEKAKELKEIIKKEIFQPPRDGEYATEFEHFFYPANLAIALSYSEMELSSLVMEQWIQNDWLEISNYEFEYSGDHLISITMNLYYDEMDMVMDFDISWSNDKISSVESTTEIGDFETFADNETYEYENNTLSYYLRQETNLNGVWEDSERGNYSSTDGNIDEVIKETVNLNGNWENNERIQSQYNNDYLLNYCVDSWDIANNEWKPENKSILTYNDENFVTVFLTQIWSETEEDYVNETRLLYEYLDELVIYYLQEEWTGNEWSNLYQADLEYNDNNKITQLVQQIWQENEWQNIERVYFYYETSINEFETFESTLNFSVYPNPFKLLNDQQAVIQFNLYQSQNVNISLFNIKGQKIKIIAKRNFPNGHNSIKWSGLNNKNKPLSSGIYFIKIHNQNQIQIQKMEIIK